MKSLSLRGVSKDPAVTVTHFWEGTNGTYTILKHVHVKPEYPACVR